MSSWANLGLSALSNVTQSVQALSSYAQVVLHEAREEVESELLGGDGASGTGPPQLEEVAPDPEIPVPSLKSAAFSSRARLISPPRLLPKDRPEARDGAFMDDCAIVSEDGGPDAADLQDEILQLQTYVGALEAQLASKHRSDSASLDAVAALQRRDEECFELHRKLEIQQQQLEDMALENKLLLQAVSHKSAQNDTFVANESDQKSESHPQRQIQPDQGLVDMQNELDICRSKLSAANAATVEANAAAKAAADMLQLNSSTSASQIEAQARVISRLEADIDRLKAESLEAETSRRAALCSRSAALAAAVDHESEIMRLRGLVDAAESAAHEQSVLLSQLQEQNGSLQLQLQTLAAQAADQPQALDARQPSDTESRSQCRCAEYEQLSDKYRHINEFNSQLSSQIRQLETEFSVREQERDAVIADLNTKLASASEAGTQREKRDIQSLQLDADDLREQLKLLHAENSALKHSSAAALRDFQAVIEEKTSLTSSLKAALEETATLQDTIKHQKETHAREASKMLSRCEDLALQAKELQARNETLVSGQKQLQSDAADKELASVRSELENYAQSESKLLLELNRRLGLARRCAELSNGALAALSACGDVGSTPIAAVEEQASVGVSPTAVLSVLGKCLDHLVVKLMDLKKASEALSTSVPAIKSDSSRLMAKIVELERMRAEWSESMGELLQTKSALAKQAQQLQTQNQLDLSVLSVLQSCGGSSPGETLHPAAVRVSEELKTARMTVAELARQVEVERSSSSNRTRAADSQGSDLKAALAAAEKRHAAEVSAVKAQLRTSEVQCQQALFDLQAANKLNSELNEQVSVFESVLAEKDAEVAEVSQQLQLARTLVTNLSEQTEVAVNLELVRARKRSAALEEQLQEALGAKAVLETDIKTMQALPVRIRDLEVALAKKEREMSLLQVVAAQAQEDLKVQSARSRSEAHMVDRRLVSNLLIQYIVGNSSRKSEVLKLIAQVLEFDDDMQRRVGLSDNGWLTWLSGSQANPSDETQNIGDMWVKFLLESAKSDQSDARPPEQ